MSKTINDFYSLLNLIYLEMKDSQRGGLKSMHHIDFEDKYGIEVN